MSIVDICISSYVIDSVEVKDQIMAKMLTSGRKHQNLHISSLMYVVFKNIKIHMIPIRDLKKIGAQKGVPLIFATETPKVKNRLYLSQFLRYQNQTGTKLELRYKPLIMCNFILISYFAYSWILMRTAKFGEKYQTLISFLPLK